MPSSDFTIADIIRITLKGMHWIVLISLLFGGATYVGCKYLKPYYSLTALFEAPELSSVVGAQAGASSKIGDLLLGKSNPKASLTNDVVQIMTIRLLADKPAKGKNAYLKSVILAEETNLIKVEIWGTSPEAAKNYINEILSELSPVFTPKVAQAKSESEQTLAILKSRINEIDAHIVQIEKSIKDLGPLVPLIEQEVAMKGERNKAEFSIIQIEGDLRGNKIHDISLVASRTESDFPAFPKTKLFIVAGTALGAILALMGLVVREEDALSKKLKSNPGATTPQFFAPNSFSETEPSIRPPLPITRGARPKKPFRVA